ncbi:Npun_R2821/Npun_R2822 family protein [Nostoc sp. TCL26-01]|uniref:Npun_R2821/Npun_R2822 family protein n=1 Tax=Nostoc sp. TCL26-01 TaxID=2576904 RepID=UPI0015BCAD73|nr:Npun_R2821/Npun_R2822 family protein [Nostoc sp. TCL26-01]QLE56561.1 sugar transferase [Nostoc sp. TCL26-01]
MVDGIYILANDVVYHQLVALLNSIEVNAGKNFPICIIPYDDRLELVKEEIQHRDNVELFTDTKAITIWEDFSTKVWQTHPYAWQHWQEDGIPKVYRLGMHRRFCGFDGIFDKFIYLDADILILNSLDYIFQQLNSHDFVVYDFQYKDLSHVYNANSTNLLNIFPQQRLESEIFCAGLYGSKRGVFDEERRNYLLSCLEQGEAEILYMNAPDQTILNYMVMRSGISSYNFARHLPKTEVTGCCVTSPHFQTRNNLLYDRGNQITYLHYIGLKSRLFNSVCDGENIDFPYRELFLHYRYLHEPEKRPQFTTKSKPYKVTPNLATRIFKKLGLKV